MQLSVEQIPRNNEEEVRIRCHDPEETWVMAIRAVAAGAATVIGTASLNRKPNRMRHRGEFGISLKKAWWGCGAAFALMERILAFARENGVEQVNLEVRSDNKRAIALYERFGFRKLCTFPGFFKINGELIDFDFMNLSICPGENEIH